MNEEVQLELNDTKGFFHIDINGKTEGKMTFVFAGPDKIIIDHTEVNPGNNGKGYGKKMVAKAVEYAREKNIKIFHFVLLPKKYWTKLLNLEMYFKSWKP